jgi:hypothetical protein
MKKILNQITIVLTGLLLFTACKKTELAKPQSPAEEESEVTDYNAKKPQPAISKVHTRTAGNDVRTYTYDNMGRQTQSSSTANNSIVYEYDGSLVDYWIYYPGGTLAGSTVGQLNNNGLLTSYTSTNPNGTFALSGIYTYNASRQQTGQEVNFSNGDQAIGTFTFQSDNLVSAESHVNGSLSWTKTHTYYLNKQNTLSNEAFGQPYYGTSSKNLVKSTVFTIIGGATTTEEFKYEFDPQGRVTKVKTTKNGVQQPDIIYTYY